MKCRLSGCTADAGPYGLCSHHVAGLTILDRIRMRDAIIAKVATLAANGADFDMVMDARLLVDTAPVEPPRRVS